MKSKRPILETSYPKAEFFEVSHNLPFLHRLVELKDFMDEKRNYDNPQQRKQYQVCSNNLLYCEVDELTNDVEYAIQSQTGKLYIYAVIESGSCGIVYLAHDDELNWFAVKDHTPRTPLSNRNAKKVDTQKAISGFETKDFGFREYLAKQEIKNLNKARKKEVGEISCSDTHIFTIMPVEQGVDLYTFLHSNPKTSMAMLIDIAIDITTKIDSLLNDPEIQIIHRDIKLENLILNLVTRQISVIDYAFAINKKTPKAIIRGTPEYMAPEIPQVFNDSFAFGDPTDIYALGKALALLFGFLDESETGDDLEESRFIFPGYLSQFRTKEKEAFNKLYNLIKSMLARDPNQRPPLAEVMETLQDVRLFCPDLTSSLKKTGLFNVDEYQNASKDSKKQIVETLKNAKLNEVHFIDTQKRPSSHYAIIRKELESQDQKIPVGNTIYYGPDTTTILQTIPKQPDPDRFVRAFVYVSTSADQKEISNILTIQTKTPPDEIHKQMSEFLKKQKLSNNQLYYAITNLEKEIERINNKYKKDKPLVIWNRIKALREAKWKLEAELYKRELKEDELKKQNLNKEKETLNSDKPDQNERRIFKKGLHYNKVDTHGKKVDTYGNLKKAPEEEFTYQDLHDLFSDLEKSMTKVRFKFIGSSVGAKNISTLRKNIIRGSGDFPSSAQVKK